VGGIDDALRSRIVRGVFLEPVQQGAERIRHRGDVLLDALDALDARVVLPWFACRVPELCCRR